MALIKGETRRYVMDITGLTLLFLAAGCSASLYIVKIEEIKIWYAGIEATLLGFEKTIAAIEDRWIFYVVIALLYCIKSVFPVISTSVLCLITGMVLPVYIALPLNIAGISMNFSINYFLGRRFGGGNAQKLIYKSKRVRSMMESNGKGNPWLLIAFRVFPNFPINSVSQIYGQMRFKYVYFILLSLLGYAPKLISYTFIGRNVYKPLSASFLSPIISLLTIFGLSLLFINVIWNFVGKRKHIVQGEKILNKK